MTRKIKKYKIQILIFVSVVVLTLLISIQFRWINKAHKLTEKQLSHRVGLALSESVHEFVEDKQSCYNVRAFMSKPELNALDSALFKEGKARLDSIIQKQFLRYQIKTEFTTKIHESKVKQPDSNHFHYCLGRALNSNKTILNVYFKKQDECSHYCLRSLFAYSIILIAILCVFLGITIISLIRDKKILSRITDLVNNITHEFKTPIATISLASSMLKREKIFSESNQVLHYSDMISSENNRLKKQIEQLLKLTYIERGELKMNSNEFDLHTLLEESFDCISVQLKERNGKVDFKIDAANDLVFGDRELLKNVFVNIFDNAVKYSPKSPEIEVETKNVNNSVSVLISDSGIGISRDEQRNIFDKYYRVSTGDIHDVKGFGIGLSYSKMIVDAHEGSINVSSKIKSGSTFTVVLPLVCK